MSMITEDYVSFEVAKLLKEKGFDQNCATYYLDGQVWRHYHGEVIPKGKQIYAAPTQAMAMKWLRKNYQIFIRPNISFLYPIKWYSEIFCYGDNLKTQQDIKTEYYDSPEQACEAAIKYCLENLI